MCQNSNYRGGGCDGAKRAYGLGSDKQCRILVVVSDDVAATDSYDCILEWWRKEHCDKPDNDDESASLLYVVVTDGVCWRIYPVARGDRPTMPVSTQIGSGAIPLGRVTVAETVVPYEEWAILPSENVDSDHIFYPVDLREKFTAKSCLYLLRLWKSLVMELGNGLGQLMEVVGPSAVGTKSESCWVKCIELLNDDYATKIPTKLRHNEGELRELERTSWSNMYITLAKWLHGKDILDDECLDKDVTIYRSKYKGADGFSTEVGNGFIIHHASARQLREYTVRLLRLVKHENDANVDGYEVCLEEKGK